MFSIKDYEKSISVLEKMKEDYEQCNLTGMFYNDMMKEIDDQIYFCKDCIKNISIDSNVDISKLPKHMNVIKAEPNIKTSKTDLDKLTDYILDGSTLVITEDNEYIRIDSAEEFGYHESNGFMCDVIGYVYGDAESMAEAVMNHIEENEDKIADIQEV